MSSGDLFLLSTYRIYTQSHVSIHVCISATLKEVKVHIYVTHTYIYRYVLHIALWSDHAKEVNASVARSSLRMTLYGARRRNGLGRGSCDLIFMI